jgi:hypothetical protein
LLVTVQSYRHQPRPFSSQIEFIALIRYSKARLLECKPTALDLETVGRKLSTTLKQAIIL